MQPTTAIKPSSFQAIAEGECPLLAIPTDLLRVIIQHLGPKDPAHFVLKLVNKRFIPITAKMNYPEACYNVIGCEAWKLFKYFYPSPSPQDSLTDRAAQRGHLNVAQWMHVHSNDHLTHTGVEGAIKNGHLGVMHWAYQLGFSYVTDGTFYAAAKGKIQTLEWCLSMGSKLTPGQCEMAARNGHLHVVQWLRSKGCKWDQRSCAAAAQGGHLNVLQWLREQGCPWDEKTCYKAAGKGHLVLLQWARSQGCPWNEKTYVRALKGKQSEIVEWSYANGCPLPSLSVDLTPKKKYRMISHQINRYPEV